LQTQFFFEKFIEIEKLSFIGVQSQSVMVPCSWSVKKHRSFGQELLLCLEWWSDQLIQALQVFTLMKRIHKVGQYFELRYDHYAPDLPQKRCCQSSTRKLYLLYLALH